MGWRKMYFKRRLYEVRVIEEVTGFTHIAIKRQDGKPIVASWDVFQAIKNAYVGESCYAVEVFPDQPSLVYQENMRHLWVFPEGERLPLSPYWG
jgi:hypothetical protein